MFILAGCESAGAEDSRTACEKIRTCCEEGYSNHAVCDDYETEDDCELSLSFSFVSEECVNGHFVEKVNKSGLVIATAPNEFVGDFTFNGEVVCVNVNVCEKKTIGEKKTGGGVVWVKFFRQDSLFLNKVVGIDPMDPVKVFWDEPEDWGLAPNGTYRDEADQYEGEATTEMVDGHFELHWAGSILGIVDRNSFSVADDAIEISNGIISDDLKTITYHKTYPQSNKEFDIVLTRVE